MLMGEGFMYGFSFATGVLAAVSLFIAGFWSADMVRQFILRYSQASNPLFGINKSGFRARALFALHAAWYWPRL